MATRGLFGDDIKRQVSTSKKYANDFQRQKDIMDIYDLWYGDFRDYEQIDKYDINYDLFNGRLDVNLYDDPVCLNIDGEKVKLEYSTITHYPLISQVANAMHGEMIARPFVPVAKDLGAFSQTLRNKKWNELIRQMLNDSVIQPIRDEVTRAYLAQNNISDQFQMTPEQLQQMQADIENRVQAKTPEDVLDFMTNDFQTPTQRQAQQLLDYLVAHHDIKWKQEEGFKHALITGREIYYIGDRHGEPTFELVNPKYFHWAGSQNTEWIQDGSWAKSEQWLTIEDAMQKHAEQLTRKSHKELLGMAEPIGGLRAIGDPHRDFVQNRTMYELSIDKGYMVQKHGDINYKTREGQSRIVKVYEDIIKKYGANYGYAFSNYGIREAHICWRDKRKLKRVTRIIRGEEKQFWQDEHYVTKPEDIKVVEVWVDEVWEGWKLGGAGGEDVYVNIRPIPGQYPSIFNPFGAKLPYVGRNYNTHMNNTRNVSLIDLGKPWQKEFDATMAQVKHDMATDIGKIFLFSMGLKPDDWKWQDWFNTMLNGRLAVTDFKKHGFSNLDPQSLRAIDLSRSSDIANKIQLLDYFRANLVRAMNFNDARIGSIGEYTTNQNIQQQQTASYNQTEGYFETHRKIVEKALNMFMNRARLVYKNNHKRSFIMDDVARTELEMSPDFWYEEWAVEFTTSSDEVRKVEELRQQMLAFVQNGMSFDGVLELMLAKTPTDIANLMRKENRRVEEMRQQQQQAEQQRFEQQMQLEQQKAQAERQSKEQIEYAKIQAGTQRAEIEADKFRRQGDVDRNNLADTIQKALIELQAKHELEMQKIAAEERKQEKELERKDRELDIKEREAQAKMAQARNKSNN